MATLSPPPGEYKFSYAQNNEFRVAAYWMGIMGRLGVLFGALACLAFLLGSVPGLIGVVIGIVGILIGVWTVKAASAFRRVADTTDRDIENLLEAVANLKKLYRLQAILVGVVCGLIVVAVVAGFSVGLLQGPGF